jgi:hypothetical protein
LDHFLKEIKERITWEIGEEVYGDSFVKRGLPLIVMNCDRKAGRIYQRVIIGKQRGRDDFQHELDDLTCYAIYANLYYRMLKETLGEEDAPQPQGPEGSE